MPGEETELQLVSRRTIGPRMILEISMPSCRPSWMAPPAVGSCVLTATMHEGGKWLAFDIEERDGSGELRETCATLLEDSALVLYKQLHQVFGDKA